MNSSDDLTVGHGAGTRPATPLQAFTPGQVIADRYRMVGLLGRGGMGEVYRADDLVLGTPVALKFLPWQVQGDLTVLERFRAEVRIARQVSHPHVCRVFDIAEVGGRQFLSMEYVDGEDLATLLRRIGRLPHDKAVELSRQLCAGLAAAHQQGVLHRDLKPANVMVDGHGRVRITDFGLAVMGAAAAQEFAGTPAYMSPEQLAGRPATLRSDIYALGLVLYEMFTGARSFAASTVEEWRQAHTHASPTHPSQHVPDIDASVARVILRCLEKDPSARPATVSHVALSLPGGDPLAMAIAAGETPSPAMVAAAGGEGGLAHRPARLILGLTLAALAGIVAVSPYSTDFGLAPMTRSPEVLRYRAQELIRELGYPQPARDETTWLERDYGLLRWMADHLVSTDWRRRIAGLGPPVLFTYRRADQPLSVQHANGLITDLVPPAVNGSGDLRVVFDGSGRLRTFVAVPSPWQASPKPGREPSVDVFAMSGLAPDRFSEVPPTFVPPVPFDRRREWTGTRPELPEAALTLSVASFDGRLVSIAVLGPWNRVTTKPLEAAPTYRIQQVGLATFLVVIVATIAELARRHLRAGRGDRRGAARIAACATVLTLMTGLLTTHVAAGASFDLLELIFGTGSQAVFDGLLMWLAYLAVEPYCRRVAPAQLVGWARLLEGRWRDPAVGRDVLAGVALGAVLSLILHLTNGAPTWVAMASQTPIPGFTVVARGGGVVTRVAPIAAMVSAPYSGLEQGLFLFAAVILLRTFLNRPVALALTALLGLLVSLGGENAVLELPWALLMGCALAWASHFAGLLTLVVMLFALRLAGQNAMLGGDLSLWYGPHAWAALAALIALAVTTYRTATGGTSANARPGADLTRP